MQGILYEEHSAWLFLLVTVVLGGAASWQMGRAIAQTWRPLVMLPVYVALLNCAVRFIHFAMFQGTLLSLHYYLVDFIFLMGFALLGWRMKRTEQMKTQYAFAFEGSGPLSWKRKG
jgi:TRAP-type mannitol/chloroaromatic compound transport system permease small subunit